MANPVVQEVNFYLIDSKVVASLAHLNVFNPSKICNITESIDEASAKEAKPKNCQSL